MQHISSIRTLSILLSAAFLQSCGWVDSTGNQAQGQPSGTGISTPTGELDPTIRSLSDGEPTYFLENTANRAQLNGSGSQARGWNWELTEEGNNEACENVDGFDPRYAMDSLEDACIVQSQCELRIDETADSEQTEFIIDVPALTSPVAITYQVSAAQEDGSVLTRDQTICALSVNEAPSAGNDNYRALAGVQRTVRAGDSDSLLANDSDDVDARNQPLSVNTRVVIAPRYADAFSLQANGGFTYTAGLNTPQDSSGEQTDTFVYSVSDGLHEVNATVTLTIATSNNAPAPIGTLPDVQVDLSSSVSGPVYDIDVSAYFNDMDNDPLRYRIDVDNLPDGLLIRVSDGGLLSIDIDTNNLTSLPGEWQVNVFASDGLTTTSTDFQFILIDSAQILNRPPIVSDIANRFVGNTFQYDVSGFFNDPDGDTLTFSSERLPPTVQLSASGIISGRSNNQNSGAWFVVVQASDEFGTSVSDGFLLVIN